MRTARVKETGGGYYHCMSRVIERRFALGQLEKEVFRKMMRKVEGFSGVQILTYTVLDNHFHILLHVPEYKEISDKELIRRMKILYDHTFVNAYAKTLRKARKDKQEAYVAALRKKYLYRMNDVSQFMKSLKQRFSMWYNKQNRRRGTLWEERFKSILVEDSENALIMMASYIDLNPVRAGIVKDPKDYRYCGYGEAAGGHKEAREGLAMIMLTLDQTSRVWGQVSHKYRRMLYVRGQATEKKHGFSRSSVQKVLDKGGKLSTSEALRCRVRYFSDGVALGSREYVEDVYRRFRKEAGAKRKTGARPMRRGQWGGLCTMRDLRLEVISLPLN